MTFTYMRLKAIVSQYQFAPQGHTTLGLFKEEGI